MLLLVRMNGVAHPKDLPDTQGGGNLPGHERHEDLGPQAVHGLGQGLVVPIAPLHAADVHDPFAVGPMFE